MAHRTPGPLRTLGVLLRALTGLALLLALVAGVPYALLAVGHQPTELTGGWDLLMSQDDGTAFLVVLTLLGWAAWAAFTFSVLVELVAVLRRRSAPRIKGLGGLQSFAGFLVGAVVLLAPTAASAAVVSPASAATVHTAVSEPGPTAAPSGNSTSSPSARSDRPQHTVTSPTESPWDLAETYLGSGQRWKDIAALNPGIPELAAGDGYLPQGTVVTLPADAKPAGQSPAAATTPGSDDVPHKAAATADDEKAPEAETVRAGDSLWSIAARHGDPTQWHAIYDANKGEAQPGGGHFDNPDLIYPGQKLDIPQQAKQESPAPEARTDNPPPTTHQHTPTSKTPEAGHGDRQGTAAQHPAPPATTAPAPSSTANPAPDTTPAPAPSAKTTGPAHVQPTHEHNDQALAPAAMWMGAGALAAALIGTLALRRRLQQRRLRPGRRIPMPQGRAAATEQGLRAAQHPTGFDLLDTALRTLALNLAAVGRELPFVEAVVLHESRVELHLDQDTAPMKPFASAAGRQDLWTCSATNPDLADDETLQDADAPYPVLVSIGWDAQGHLVLVDLEHVGILQLAGDEDFARHVLQAIAVELANTPVPGHLEVAALGDTAPGLEAAAPARVARTDVTDAATDLAAHTADQRRALAGIGATSLRHARLSEDTAGDWTPHVVLAENLPEGADTDRLLDALTQQPTTAAAVITTTPTGPEAGAWTLSCQSPDDTIVLPGSRLPIRLQGLSDEHFADAVELLTLAASETDVPAPEWVTADPDEDDTAGEPGEDGLPAEYADLEEKSLDDDSSTHPAEKGDHDLAAVPTAPENNPPEPEDLAATDNGPSVADHDPQENPRTEPVNHPTVLAAPCAPPARAVHATVPAPATTTPSPTEEPAPASGPRVLLLGIVQIEGATGRLDSNRKNIGVELVAYLALNPGVDHHAIDDALWPGRQVKKDMRNAVISRTRSWLAKDEDGNPHFPRVPDTGDSRYRLGPKATCDWTDFQKHARKGLIDQTEDGDLALRRALALVRGRPFAGINPVRYTWAEPISQEMISAIAHVAYELSTRLREAGDIPGALLAARQGLLACEENETLHRQIFLAHHAAGDDEALRKAAANLMKINEQLGGIDIDDDTAELLRDLLPRPVITH
ncbi:MULTISPECIES: LysM peptidoglycan-binding domain-containing protein [unclassified Streptomyces]|uniref:LysM peptidoglycan-binding domain-containing protein n=1 Tax=unclassified Streptomyces TaxID=2593676 RepID=UPI002E1BBE02|nr:LysM peptidoglycan-binding domain-containing protein [Streptomyces sp. NBC_00963]